MFIESIEIENFRNYESLHLDFDKRANILYGNNAQGKTNILEAIYISSTSKSHKGCKDKELIRFGQNESHIKTNVLKDEKSYQIDIFLKNNKKKGIAINRVPLKKASDIFGILNTVVFSPEDLNIIKEGPAARRKFIDSELCQVDKIYLSDLTNYNKVLAHRNKLLKDIFLKPELKETLSIWDMQLVEYGKKIIKRRYQFIEELNETIVDIHSKLSGNTEIIKLTYEPNIEDMFFMDELISVREKDLRYSQTSVGPHRDDIKITLNDIDIRKFGSQGQQRTAALSMKLSEIKMVEKNTGEKPVLLLDDVLSELDSNRQNFLIQSIEDVQTIITCTGVDEFVKSQMNINNVYEVINGEVFKKS